MSVAFRAAATPKCQATGAVNATVTGNSPAGVQVGDFLIAKMAWNTAITPGNPTGWVQIGATLTVSTLAVAHWYRFADGTANDTFSVACTNASTGVAFAVTVEAYTGVDTANPINAQAFANAGATASASHATPAITTTVDGCWILESACDKGSPASQTWTAPSGFTSRGVANAATAAYPSLVSADSNSAKTAGAYGGDTFTGSLSTTTAAISTVAIAPSAAAPPPTPTLVNATAEVGQSTVEVAAKVTGSTTLTLKVSTNSNMTSPVFTSATLTADGQGYVHATATGLTANTVHYWQFADSGTLFGAVGQAKTLKPAGSAQNLNVAFGSCVTTGNTDGTAFTDLLGWAPDFLVHLGDYHYRGTTTQTTASHVSDFESQWATSTSGQLAAVHKALSVFYVPSDHEAGPDNGGSNDTAEPYWPYQRRAVESFFPVGSLADARTPRKGLYRTWVVGRIRFIQIDVRNGDRTDVTAVGTAGDTMLGATQKAWLKTQLTQSEPVKIVLGDTAWMGTETNGAVPVKGDWWPAYPVERQELIDFIAANSAAVGHIEYWHGDSHLVGYATAAKNTWGNFPVLCAAPFANTGGGQQTSTFSAFYTNGGGQCRQYGRVTFTDNGTTITRTFQGWDAVSATAQVTATATVTTGGAAPAATRFVLIAGTWVPQTTVRL